MNTLNNKEIKLSPNALKVLEKRYLLKRQEDRQVVETPHELFTRIAKAIAGADINFGRSIKEVEDLERKFYSMMTTLEFLPNSPTIMNAGRRLGQLSACFVIPVEDSMESIFEAVKHSALIHKSGGGTGFSFSRLRPNGDVVGSTEGISSGPVSFMSVFDVATEAVKQGGTRRGANMAILRVDHPDIINFITCKNDPTKFNNFNISIALTDKFMSALQKNEHYELVNPRTCETVKTIEAGYIFELIVENAWKNGEPGIIFIDRINQSNPTGFIGEIESTNPCGEQPLLPYESCNLGSINLAKMLTVSKKDATDDKVTYEVDWQKLSYTIDNAVHFLDNVIDINKYPLDVIKKNTLANRKIGLGVMGWADMLIALEIAYNCDEALNLAEKLMQFIRAQARKASEALAEQRGTFPNYKGSIYDGKTKLRNATTTTIAPTGTLSIIASCSSGIEPIFALSYVKNVMGGAKLIEVNPYFETVAKERGFYSQELMDRISKKNSIKDFGEIPDDIKKVFVTAHDITPEDHIKMQASFQKYVDNAVSKTVNFTHDATIEDVKEVYMLAYKLGCKGVTVYRDGSRNEQVLSLTPTPTITKPPEQQINKPVKIMPRKRPSVIKGTTHALSTGCGSIYVTVNEDENNLPFEVFNHIGKAGGCAASQSEAIGRLASLALRCNIATDEIIKQLKGISCHQPSWATGGKILSCADAIGKAIEQYIKGVGNSRNKLIQRMGACPECGGAVEHEGGCAVCHDCGFTKCG